MSRDFLEQSKTTTTERVDSKVKVIHMFRPDSNDLLSHFRACGLVVSVIYTTCTVSANINENCEAVPSASASRINVGSW